MTRALRDPRWLGGLSVAVVFAVVCVLLAQWQLDRRVERAERNAAVLENYDSAPVALAEALPSARQVPDAQPSPTGQWTPVRLRGEYDRDATVLVRNRPQDDSNGYLVAVPFDTTLDGVGPVRLLLVRGWVPAGARADRPASVPDPPGGVVEVVARLRSGESPPTRSAPEGQTYRLHLPTLLGPDAGTTDAAVLTGTYGVVASEDGTAPAGLATLERPDTDPGPHLAYGVQWYLFALAGLGIWGVLAHRHARQDPPDVVGAGPDPWVYHPGG